MQKQFLSLHQILVKYQFLWRFEPFHWCASNHTPWSEKQVELDTWLNTLTPSDIEKLKHDPSFVLQQCVQWFPELAQLSDLTSLPQQTCTDVELDRSITTGMPGRKLAQVAAMGQAAINLHQGQQWLEWCSGKGFLGRVLAKQTHEPVTSFEWQQSLCEQGQHAAKQLNLPIKFVQGDAFSAQAQSVFNTQQHAVALHACGDLHTTLLQQVVQHHLPAVTISPCCYHLIQAKHYQCLSALGQKHDLNLSVSELRIPLQETVTGGQRVKVHRQQEMVFRLGLQSLLQRELHKVAYEPVPSIKKSLLADGFKAFCLWAAKKKGWSINDEIDFIYYEKIGTELFWKMEKLSLIQQLFHRALEMWLTLDKALYLQQAGYHVSLSEFCEKSVTPRNILIHANQ